MSDITGGVSAGGSNARATRGPSCSASDVGFSEPTDLSAITCDFCYLPVLGTDQQAALVLHLAHELLAMLASPARSTVRDGEKQSA